MLTRWTFGISLPECTLLHVSCPKGGPSPSPPVSSAVPTQASLSSCSTPAGANPPTVSPAGRSYLAVLAAPKEKESLFDSLVVRSSQDEVEVSWGSAGIEVFLPSS